MKERERGRERERERGIERERERLEREKKSNCMRMVKRGSQKRSCNF